MEDRVSKKVISKTIQKAIQKDLFKNEYNSILFHDLDYLKLRVERLKDIFPSSALHSIATKANLLPRMHEYLKKLEVGAEAATLPDVYLAVKSGYDASKIVFDSPAKTYKDIKYVVKIGFHLNADSLDELDRIGVLVKLSLTFSLPFVLYILNFYEPIELYRIRGSIKKWTAIKNLIKNIKNIKF